MWCGRKQNSICRLIIIVVCCIQWWEARGFVQTQRSDLDPPLCLYLYFFFVICLLWFRAVNEAGYPLAFSAPPLLVSHRVVVIFTCTKEVVYFAPGRGAKYCDERACRSVCLSVCVSARKSLNTHVQTSQTFPVYVACGRPPDNNAIRCVGLLPVFWMTSCVCPSDRRIQTRCFVYIGWQWRNFFISAVFRHFMGQALRNVCCSDASRRHFLNKIAIVRTFS